jgi:hypothetical protein
VKDVEEVDIAPALSAAALAVKDENELVSFLVYAYDRLLKYNLACYEKCFESLYRPYESLLR